MRRHEERDREGGEQRGKEEEFTAKRTRERERARNRQQWKREGAFELTVAVRIFSTPARSLLPRRALVCPHCKHRLWYAPRSSNRWTYLRTPGVWKSAEDQPKRTAPYMEQTLTLDSVSVTVKSGNVSVCLHLSAVLWCHLYLTHSLAGSIISPSLGSLWLLL